MGWSSPGTLVASDGLVSSEGTSTTRCSARFVTTEWSRRFGRESDQGPPRCYYTLTDRGRESLKVFVEHWERFRSAVHRLLADGTE